MKRFLVIALSVALIVALVINVIPAMAAKRKTDDTGMLVGNGYPSGPHFNLNIHGKNESFYCNPADWIEGGNSVFIDEYGTATLQLLINKKSNLTELSVLQGCAIDGGTATVQLPWKIMTDDEGLKNANGYFMYARIRGKPQNGNPNKNEEPEPSLITVSSHRVIQSCTEPDEFNNCTGMLLLGYTDMSSAFLPGDETFERWADPTVQGKGNKKAVNITQLLRWTGWIVAESLDIGTSNGTCTSGPDGKIDECDIPAGADFVKNLGTIPDSYDSNGDGILQIEEWLIYKADQYQADPETEPYCVYYENEWIWNVNELVLTEQDITNDGTKLFKIRFYPVSTTTFTEKAHISVVKMTVPETDVTTEFSFTTSYPPGMLTLNNRDASLDEVSTLGPHWVTEIVPEGWDLTSITVDDPDHGSDPTQSGDTAIIDLDAGETVTVTFTNTQRGNITVVKEVIGAAPVSDWGFNGTGDLGAFTLPAGGGQQSFNNLLPGSYTITETPQGG